MVANQLNALIRLKCVLAFQERESLVNTFVPSNFNYCTLTWMYASSKCLTKIENWQNYFIDGFCIITCRRLCRPRV